MSFRRFVCALGVPAVLSVVACTEDDPDPPHDAGRDAGEPHDAALPDREDGGLPDERDAQTPRDASADASADGGPGDAGPEDAGPVDDGALPEPPPAWYEADEPLVLSLSGAFGDAFAAAFAGVPDGIVPPVRKKDPFAASAAYADVTHADAVLAIRGNSSLQECAFPKLKLTFAARVSDEADVFFGTKKLKIATHCGEEEEVNGTIGRLRNERAAWREQAVYRLAHTLGITIMETRLATIRYTDTSADPAFPAELERKAFLLEHIDELARRLGATALVDPVDCGEDTGKLPNGRDVLRVKFFHALVGNWDFTLGPPEASGCGSLYNTEVLVYPDGARTLVPADFDLAAMVVGEVQNPETNRSEPITIENASAWARDALARAVAGESSASVDAIKAEYRAHEAALRAALTEAPIDPPGKAAALLMVDAFFAVLAER